nr:enoyl-CoA hydratase/isomerase family protein [Desulfobacterales bacterium]
MGYNNIILEKEGRVAKITLNRPSAMNSLNLDTLNEMADALIDIEGDAETRVVILTGNGRAFCAGADLAFIKTVIKNPIKMDEFLHRWKRVFSMIEDMPLPVIGAINGFALAGGLELAMVCDILIASEEARIGDQHANYGLIPGGGGTQRLPRKIPFNKAKELVLTGAWLSPQEAEKLGLVNRVVPPDKLQDEAMGMAKQLAEKSPVASKTIKWLMNKGIQLDLDSALELEIGAALTHFHTEDVKEGLRAFLEKRKPEFKGK